MARGINKVILIGNLGADPDVRYMPSGDPVATVRLATSESWKDKNTGEAREQTEWHRVVFFRGLAEVVKQYLRKGSKIYVEGKLRTRKWQGQDGVERYTTEVVVDVGGTMQMLDGRGAGGNTVPYDEPAGGFREPGDYGTGGGPGGGVGESGSPGAGGGETDKPDFDDDIPF